VIAPIERFAPGFRDRVVGLRVTRPADFAAWNLNFAGGEILTGAKDLRQFVLGPRATRNPYATGVPGIYLCSAATPPGPEPTARAARTPPGPPSPPQILIRILVHAALGPPGAADRARRG